MEKYLERVTLAEHKVGPISLLHGQGPAEKLLQLELLPAREHDHGAPALVPICY